MRERKYVKFRTDMYEDTKFKIIDMKPERDVIHYIWNRLVILAGKVNLEGDLFLSKNIPYTIETLALEFNRDSEMIKLALETFIELEMIEIAEDKIYNVKNFVKHQNIKVKDKEKEEVKSEDTTLKNIDHLLNIKMEEPINTENRKDGDDKIIANSIEGIASNNLGSLETKEQEGLGISENLDNKKSLAEIKGTPPVTLENTKCKRKLRKKKNYIQQGSFICTG